MGALFFFFNRGKTEAQSEEVTFLLSPVIQVRKQRLNLGRCNSAHPGTENICSCIDKSLLEFYYRNSHHTFLHVGKNHNFL